MEGWDRGKGLHDVGQKVEVVKLDISFEESSSEGKGDDDKQDVCNCI